MVKTHFQPGGEVCESATLPDGRVIRVVRFEHYRSITGELRAWLVWLGFTLLLFGCGGAEFSPGGEQPVEASAPDDAGRGGSADVDGGDEDATTTCPTQPTPCRSPGYGRLQDGGCGCLPSTVMDGAVDTGPADTGAIDAACLAYSGFPDGGFNCGSDRVSAPNYYVCVTKKDGSETTLSPAAAFCGPCATCSTCDGPAVCSLLGQSFASCSDTDGELRVSCF